MDMSTPLARLALQDMTEALEAAQAKAFVGLARNWRALQVRETETETEAERAPSHDPVTPPSLPP